MTNKEVFDCLREGTMERKEAIRILNANQESDMFREQEAEIKRKNEPRSNDVGNLREELHEFIDTAQYLAIERANDIRMLDKDIIYSFISTLHQLLYEVTRYKSDDDWFTWKDSSYDE